MQVSIENTSVLERRLAVGLPAEQIDNEVLARLQKAAKTARIDGFRPGKVPLTVIRQRFGTSVRQEVVEEIINRSYYDAVTEHNLRPAGRPTIDRVTDVPGQSLEYAAVFEVYPEIVLADFATLTVTKPHAVVTDADVEKTIGMLRQQHATWVDVERAAATGDQVNIDFTGTRDGVQFQGGTGQGMDLILGSGRMIPGFEDAIVGLLAGGDKNVELSFPADYPNAELKGAAVRFAIKVNAVRSQQLPGLDDAFFARFGVSDGGEDKFRSEVRKNMERELTNAINNKLKTRLMNQLYDRHQIPLPKALVANEALALREQTLNQLGGEQGLDPSILPIDLFMVRAQRRVAMGLLIVEIVKIANIALDNDRVRAKIEDIAATYEQPEQVVRYYHHNQQLLASVQSAVLEEQAVEHVLSCVTLSEESVSYEAAVKPDSAPKPTPVNDA